MSRQPQVISIAALCVLAACKNDNSVNNIDDNEQVDDDELACIVVDPPSIDFGSIRVGEDIPRTEIVTIRADSDPACEADLELYGAILDDVDAPFSLGTLGAITLSPGSSTDMTVTFDPQTSNEWTAQALITSNDADDETSVVELIGAGIAPAIEIAPDQYDFGDPFIGCELTQPYTISNVGTADLVVTELYFASGSPDFAMDRPAELPFTLAPGESTDLTMTYLGLDAFADTAFLTAYSNDPWTPEAFAAATGTAHVFGDGLDEFEQPLEAATDVLFIVDNSCSMGDEQASLTSNFESFITTLTAADADYQVAVITTDSPDFRGPVISPITADPIGEFTTQALAGTNGGLPEQGLEMAYQSTQPGGDAGPGGQFLRDDALLAIVIVTDESDYSQAHRSDSDYADYWLGLKNGNPDLLRFHTVGGDLPVPTCNTAAGPANHYADVTTLTGGLFISVCAPDWGQSFEDLAQGSITLHNAFPLSDPPVPATISVKIDGVETYVGWRYEDRIQSVVFQADSLPEGGSTIDITYSKMPDTCEQ